jgi:hypothetical protein
MVDPMRVIFLDIDGVLNSERFMRAQHERGVVSKDVEEHCRDQIDPAAVALLNELIETSGAEVVISSSWRRLFTIGEISRGLRHNGFAHPRSIIGKTPALDVERGHEIQAWLDERGPTDFVILDDDSDMVHLAPRLILIDCAHGLQREHVEAALRLFAPIPEAA